jgi:uncharacterized membrane protein YqhA
VNEAARSTGDGNDPAAAEQRRDQPWMLRMFASSRFFVAVAIVGAFLAGVILHVYATVLVIGLGWETLTGGERSVEGVELLSVQFVELVDVFLLGIVLYLIAVGFYQLFINAALPVPHWLVIDDLDELKVKLIAVIIVMIGVNFLGAIELDEEASVIELGIAAALVIVALALVLFVYERRRNGDEPSSGA